MGHPLLLCRERLVSGQCWCRRERGQARRLFQEYPNAGRTVGVEVNGKLRDQRLSDSRTDCNRWRTTTAETNLMSLMELKEQLQVQNRGYRPNG